MPTHFSRQDRRIWWSTVLKAAPAKHFCSGGFEQVLIELHVPNLSRDAWGALPKLGVEDLMPLRDSNKISYFKVLYDALANPTVLYPAQFKEGTLLFLREYSQRGANQLGLVNLPRPVQHFSPWKTPEKEAVQPLSWSLEQGPTLCIQAKPTISSGYHSTFRREVMFHLPTTSYNLQCFWWACLCLHLRIWHWCLFSTGVGPIGSVWEM